MPHPDEPSLVRYVAEHSSATALGVYGSSDPDAAAAALRAASIEIGQIRHPDEPTEPLPNWCAVLDDGGAPVLHLDMQDEVRYAALVVRIILDQLASAGVDGRLEPRRRPEPAFPYDANADLFTGLAALPELDARGLPPGFPDGFPVPADATLVLAQRVRDGEAEHAAWRRSAGPFDGYLERLRDYGCRFGAVPRLLTVGSPPDTIRYTLWRDGAGGSVTLYRSSGKWYVSVVWQPRAEPPAIPVEPDGAPDTRPVPTGRAAARELAEFLVPAPLVDGYETVITLATVADAVERSVGTPRGATPALLTARFAPFLGRLTAEQLTVIRHVCLSMVTNVIANGRRPRPEGLRIVPDDDGYLYAADVRERTEDPVFETGLVLVRGARMVAGAVSGIRSGPVPPPAEAYAWLFEGIDGGLLAATRDACWQIFQP